MVGADVGGVNGVSTPGKEIRYEKLYKGANSDGCDTRSCRVNAVFRNGSQSVVHKRQNI